MRTSNFFMGCALAVMALVVGCQSEEQVSENSVKEEVREDGFDEIAFMNKVKFKSLWLMSTQIKGHRALQSIPKI